MKAILLIIIGLSSLSIALETQRFTKTNGVVTDSKTTLEWQDDYSDNGNNIKSTNWIDAIDYCERLSLNGHNDWRLPNKKELLSIVDYGNFNPAISPIFDMITFTYYWSSTSYASVTNLAKIVGFSSGATNSEDKSNILSVRCVRIIGSDPK